MSLALRFSVILLLTSIALPIHAADNLEQELLKLAPDLLTKLQARHYNNVGVLKFSVKVGSQPITDQAGVLNTRLSEKLELALIVVSDPKNKNPLGIIHNANETATTIRGASHLTAAGRPRLFEKQYPLAWGNQHVTPDAFLTGIAVISSDLGTMKVYVQMFDKHSQELEQLAEFDVALEFEQLLDAGESFTVRGVFDRGNPEFTSQLREQATAEAVKTSLTTKTETAGSTKPVAAKLHPLSPDHPNSPITFEVRYDNRPQQLEFRNGAAFLPEPTEQQEVLFIVRRRGAAQPRLGVVVKVNGESTYLRERAADTQCTPWVFEPTSSAFSLRGYQVNGQQLQKFKVLTSAASQSREIDYGANVGLITISVFPEASTLQVKPAATLPETNLEVVKQNKFPSDPKPNLDALQSELALGFNRPRGIITNGETENEQLHRVPFEPASIPLLSASIRYYAPQDLPK